jgi:non-heme chloroperoxidase
LDAPASAKLVRNAQLKIYRGGPHGICTTEKDKISEDLLAFAQAGASAAMQRSA